MKAAVVLLAAVVVPGVASGCATPPTTTPVLAWRECPFDLAGLDDRIRCGDLAVPERRGRTDSRIIHLAFAVVRAQSSDRSTDAVVYLAGGPGDAALQPAVLQRLAPALARRHDVVVLDQRGTGYSRPVLCPSLGATLASIDALDLASPAAHTMRRGALLACREALEREGIDPGAYHARATVEDVEDLRRALGYQRWVVYGTSYGALVAQGVMRHYPSSVRSAVLVSPLLADWDPLFTTVPSVADTLAILSRRCAEDAQCGDRFGDVSREFFAVVESLSARPWTVRLPAAVAGPRVFTVNAGEFIDLVDELIAIDTEVPHVPRIIHAFAKREEAPVAAMLQQVLTPPPERGDVAYGARYAEWCHDAAAGAIERWANAALQHPAMLELVNPLDVCPDWRSGPVTPDSGTLLESAAPVLVVSGGLDPRTPPSYAAALLQRLPNGTQVIFPDASHVIPTPRTAQCFVRLVQQLIDDPSAPPDRRCVTDIPPLKVASGLPPWVEQELTRQAAARSR